MAHLIDKSALVAEIKRRISLFKKEKKIEKWSAEASQMNVVSLGARIAMLEEILSFFNTLEVKEVNEVPANVMLNQFGNKYISSWSGLKEYDNFQVNEEIKILIPNK